MIKSGNRYLRYYLLEAANSVRRCDSEFRRYYDLKFREVNKFQHKRALALTARKLVRLVFRLLKDNRLYILPGGLSAPLSTLAFQSCFKISQKQGFGLCCLLLFTLLFYGGFFCYFRKSPS